MVFIDEVIGSAMAVLCRACYEVVLDDIWLPSALTSLVIFRTRSLLLSTGLIEPTAAGIAWHIPFSSGNGHGMVKFSSRKVSLRRGVWSAWCVTDVAKADGPRPRSIIHMNSTVPMIGRDVRIATSLCAGCDKASRRCRVLCMEAWYISPGRQT